MILKDSSNHLSLFLLILLLVVAAARHASGLGEAHVQDVVVEEELVAGLGQDLCNFFSVLDFSDIEIGWIVRIVQGLFLDACPTSSIDLAEASALMMVLFLASFACSTSYLARSASCCATCLPESNQIYLQWLRDILFQMLGR